VRPPFGRSGFTATDMPARLSISRLTARPSQNCARLNANFQNKHERSPIQDSLSRRYLAGFQRFSTCHRLPFGCGAAMYSICNRQWGRCDGPGHASRRVGYGSESGSNQPAGNRVSGSPGRVVRKGRTGRTRDLGTGPGRVAIAAPRSRALDGLNGLGPKKSEQPYTPTDLRVL
jgi:hypothetical protein